LEHFRDHVQHLSLVKLEFSLDELLEIASLTINLQSIDMSGCANVDDSVVEALARNNGDRMKSIRANSCRGLTDDALHSLAEYCRDLNTVSVSGCKLVTHNGVVALVKKAHSMRHLELNQLPKVNNSTVVEIAVHCDQLERIDVGTAGKIEDGAILALAKNCPSLRRLNIAKSNPFQKKSFIRDESMVQFFRSLPNLEEVNMTGHRALSTDVLFAISDYCKQLKSLNLGGCVAMTSNRDMLVSCVTSMIALQELCLWSCSSVDNEVVEAILLRCPHVNNLDLDGCRVSVQSKSQRITV